MASGIVRGAISAVLEDKKLVSSPLSDAMRRFGRSFIVKVAESDREIELFDTFCQHPTTGINKIFTELSVNIRSPSAKKAKLWADFHKQRQEQLPTLFSGMKIRLDAEQSFFMQCVNQELFQQTLDNYFAKIKPIQEQHGDIPSDELNAMQYACGYVPTQEV